jgi:hypothetical protein
MFEQALVTAGLALADGAVEAAQGGVPDPA